MARRLFILFVLCLAMIQVSNGQISSTLNDFYDNFRRNKAQGGNAVSNIMGSPHENSEFEKGDIYTTLKQHYSGILLRYNIFDNQMEFRNPEGEVNIISPPDIIDSVIIGESKYIYLPFISGSKETKSFFKVLTSREPFLLIKMYVVFKEPEPPGGYKEAVPATFVRMQDELYLTLSPGEPVKVNGKKEFLEFFPARKDEIDDFIKKNKIRFSKPEEVAMVMEYIYTLK